MLLANGAYDFKVFADGWVANLCLDSLESTFRTVFRHPRRTRNSVIPHRTIRGNGLFGETQETHQRGVVAAGDGVPQRHVDGRERHANQSLRPQQTKSLAELLRDFAWRKRFPFDQGLQVLDQVSGRFQSCHGVGKDNAVSNCAVVGDDIRQHQRRFCDGAARGLMRRGHGHLDGSHAKFADPGGRCAHEDYGLCSHARLLRRGGQCASVHPRPKGLR